MNKMEQILNCRARSIRKRYRKNDHKRRKNRVSYTTLITDRIGAWREIERKFDRNTLNGDGISFLGASLVFDFLQYYFFQDIQDKWTRSPYDTLCNFYKFLQFRREHYGTKNPTVENFYYTPEEVAEIFNIDKKMVLEAIKYGELTGYIFSEAFNNRYKYIRIPISAVDKWIKIHKIIPFTKDGTLPRILREKRKLVKSTKL